MTDQRQTIPSYLRSTVASRSRSPTKNDPRRPALFGATQQPPFLTSSLENTSSSDSSSFDSVPNSAASNPTQLLKHYTSSVHRFKNCPLLDPKCEIQGHHSRDELEDGPIGPISDHFKALKEEKWPVKIGFDVTVWLSLLAVDFYGLSNSAILLCGFHFRAAKRYHNEGMANVSATREG